MADETKRVMWCNCCDTATNNIIEYHGTEKKDGVVYAVFHSRCCRCKYLKRGVKEKNVVSVESYNALISKEIYA
jgi:hypothetical protein